MALTLCKWFLLPVLSLLSGKNPDATWAAHPFYLSVTEINHNAKDRTLEISCKIFTNDFETSLSRFANTKIDLSDTKAKPLADKYIAAYVMKHLQLRVDAKPVSLQYVGSEKETDATWCYFQVDNVPSLHRLEVSNSLLYDSFETEINIIHVTVNGNRKSTKLNNPESSATFDF
jgi:hypothetical protein